MIQFCPKCGSKNIKSEGSTSEYGILFIACDTGTSTEYTAPCAIFSCEECSTDTIIECEDDEIGFDF